MFERRSFFECSLTFLGILKSPFSEQQAWQYRVDSGLWTLSGGDTFHEMDTGSFGHAICHAASTLRDGCNGRGDEVYASIGVRVEDGSGLLHELKMAHYVCCPALDGQPGLADG